jgi:hypothetical protein
MEAASQLRGILESETQGRVSVSSFIAQYLPILQFPSDVTDALVSSKINLQEAAQPARLTPGRLGCSSQQARSQRNELIKQHLAVHGSQTRLRACVKELLGERQEAEIPKSGMIGVVEKIDSLLEIDPTE